MLHTLNTNKRKGDRMISVSVDSAENITLTGLEKSKNMGTYVPQFRYAMTYAEWLDLSLDVHGMVDTLRKEFGHNE